MPARKKESKLWFQSTSQVTFSYASLLLSTSPKRALFTHQNCLLVDLIKTVDWHPVPSLNPELTNRSARLHLKIGNETALKQQTCS